MFTARNMVGMRSTAVQNMNFAWADVSWEVCNRGPGTEHTCVHSHMVSWYVGHTLCARWIAGCNRLLVAVAACLNVVCVYAASCISVLTTAIVGHCLQTHSPQVHMYVLVAVGNRISVVN